MGWVCKICELPCPRVKEYGQWICPSDLSSLWWAVSQMIWVSILCAVLSQQTFGMISCIRTMVQHEYTYDPPPRRRVLIHWYVRTVCAEDRNIFFIFKWVNILRNMKPLWRLFPLCIPKDLVFYSDPLEALSKCLLPYLLFPGFTLQLCLPLAFIHLAHIHRMPTICRVWC